MPRHRVTAGVTLTRLLGGVVAEADLSARRASSQFLRGDEANERPPLPAYAVADLRLGVEGTHLAASAHVANLFDRRYASFGVYGENPRGAPAAPQPPTPTVERFLTPGYPRALVVSVRVKR